MKIVNPLKRVKKTFTYLGHEFLAGTTLFISSREYNRYDGIYSLTVTCSDGLAFDFTQDTDEPQIYIDCSEYLEDA